MNQAHLSFKDTVNLGSFYTPQNLVDKAFDLLKRHIPNIADYKIVDTSCGYGNFLCMQNCIGADCDLTALKVAHKEHPSIPLFYHNSLHNVARSQYRLKDEDKVILVGNPPYNDTTSIIRQHLKKELLESDVDLQHRDTGMSFLLSYNKLSADYICVLHPLSYLIKKANFASIKAFTKNYILLDGLITSSASFSATSILTQFPIIIALYKRDLRGMKYNDILNKEFSTDTGKKFVINTFDIVDNYVPKYPNSKYVTSKETVAYFYTLRDINALRRSRTFLQKEIKNAIRVKREFFSLYCYIDAFKDNLSHMPYYFGNSNIFVNLEEFKKLETLFVRRSITKYKFLEKSHTTPLSLREENFITNYFKNLLGEHYVY